MAGPRDEDQERDFQFAALGKLVDMFTARGSSVGSVAARLLLAGVTLAQAAGVPDERIRACVNSFVEESRAQEARQSADPLKAN